MHKIYRCIWTKQNIYVLDSKALDKKYESKIINIFLLCDVFELRFLKYLQFKIISKTLQGKNRQARGSCVENLIELWELEDN